MTCVPTAILKSLKVELQELGVRTLDDLQAFVRREASNVRMVWVSVNGYLCTVQQQMENREALSVFTARAQGQLVSAFDPLLIFMTAVTRTNIIHRWKHRVARNRGQTRSQDETVEIKYSWNGPMPGGGSPRIVNLQSNDRHMWA